MVKQLSTFPNIFEILIDNLWKPYPMHSAPTEIFFTKLFVIKITFPNIADKTH